MPSFIRFLVLTGLLVFLGLPFVVRGQDANQQRPRRVIQGKEQSVPNGSAQAKEPTREQAAKVQEVDDGDVVRVETQLVSVPAVVTGNGGRPLVGLRAENFALFENGEQQRIANFATTEAPFEIALLLDTSGSTRADVALIRQAATAFVAALRPGDRVAILGFNTSGSGKSVSAKVEVLAKLTDERRILQKAIENLGSSNGTPYYDALLKVADEIFNESPRAEMRGRRAVVALTDGVDSSSESEFQPARTRLLRAGVACYFIQVNTEEFVEDRLLKDCQEDGRLTLSEKQMQRYRRVFAPKMRPEDYLQFCEMGSFERMEMSRGLYTLARREMNDLGKASGGKSFVAASLQDARAAFALVAAEIGTQYSLSYYPSNKARDGKYRTIKVVVQGVAEKPQVRAREGYYAPKG